MTTTGLTLGQFSSWGYLSVAFFLIAYALVTLEEMTKLRKSKPVLIAASLIWICVAAFAHQHDLVAPMQAALAHNLLEYAHLLLFLLVAMTYINALEERQIFTALHAWLMRQGFSLRQLFWATGFLAFFISPIADNLTTALLMGSIAVAVGNHTPTFIPLACINIVIAANAGGVFSPFGDITSLMVWQQGQVHFNEFFYIFIPALVSYVVPAYWMSRRIDNRPTQIAITTPVQVKEGGFAMLILFILTILTAVFFHNFLELPPSMGMMLGLGYLQLLGYGLNLRHMHQTDREAAQDSGVFDVFQKIQRAEWDTLLFFYGIMLSVGGLATLGYLEHLGTWLYEDLGAAWPDMYQATPANILLGLLSAIIDNIPMMYAILTIDPSMPLGQWLLITLTTGIGGSLLSIGSAAGVALMGQARGHYTFFQHLRWSGAILIGYFLAVLTHLYLNADLFNLSA